jgi:hypothetical protein
MSNTQPKRWSDALRAATRATLGELPILPHGLVHMKHIDNRFATMSLAELLADRYEITAKCDGEVLHFVDVDAVIAAGWAID